MARRCFELRLAETELSIYVASHRVDLTVLWHKSCVLPPTGDLFDPDLPYELFWCFEEPFGTWLAVDSHLSEVVIAPNEHARWVFIYRIIGYH